MTEVRWAVFNNSETGMEVYLHPEGVPDHYDHYPTVYGLEDTGLRIMAKSAPEAIQRARWVLINQEDPQGLRNIYKEGWLCKEQCVNLLNKILEEAPEALLESFLESQLSEEEEHFFKSPKALNRLLVTLNRIKS